MSYKTSFSQNEFKPPDRKDCYPSKKHIPVKFDTLFFYCPIYDTAHAFDTLIFNEIDSNRLISRVQYIEILPLMKKGLLNATILKNVGCPSETYSNFLLDRHGAIIKTNMTIDLWAKDCIFFGFGGEVTNLRKPTVRVFKIEVSSSTSSAISIFYLETTNLTGTSTMSSNEFINDAYISCIAKWYIEY